MKDNRFIFILLFICLLIGALTLTHYGESWDDYSLQKYADYSLRTYSTWYTQGSMPITAKDLGNYGPSYVMTVELGSHLLNNLFPLNPSDSRHIFYFITHLFGIWAFYELGKRWLSHKATIYATLLFTTQPLFWGHSFMNPKDTPFLAFFMLSLLFGLKMIDSLAEIEHATSNPPRWLYILTTLGVVAILGLFASTQLIHTWMETLVRAASTGQTNIFSLIASDILTIKPEVYIQRYFVFFLWLRVFFFIISSFLLLIATYRYSPAAFRSLQVIFFPAILLGYTTSIRILGPFAGLLVSLYAIHKLGKRVFLPIMVYALITITVTYSTWPYLWSNPIGHFMDSMQTMYKYPWFGTVLFNGVEYPPTNLPYSYLPVLLAIQFTEPIWVLFVIGAVTTIINYKEKRELIGLYGIWFALPLIGFIVMRVALYDNFRQIFFILPPLFFMAGLGMESVLKRVTRPAVQVLFAVLLILPGVVASFRLHPYEYVYYNTLVKDPNKRFELDYWATSYREAAEYINSVAPANTNILVEGPGQVAELYTREDITVLSDDEPITKPFEYVIIANRYDLDTKMYPEAKVIHKIERNRMILTVIKKME